ncbi:NAD(P)-dependent oxidoreductase [Salinicola aestuarinus]|uniref:NAD(P)-dependent oxidoreductase n=1 Tax=Salinicola aestuarinus TaxID=1949082 RepID=UPI000DA1CAF4|nr:NAD(P)-dependent oxidoreductase [Salinicola aestuarinus]
MRVLFAAREDAWGGILEKFRSALPQVEFVASDGYALTSLAGFDALIPTMTPIDAPLLETADRLMLIQQIGAGLEGVDRASAEARGIRVANVPTDISGNADSVAELGIWMMLGLARQAPRMREALAAGQLGAPMGMGLKGRTVGIVGLGGLGQALVKRLHAFDMTLMGIKRHADPAFAERHGLAWLGTLEELPTLLERCDFIILTLPDTPQTHHMIDAKALAQCQEGAFLINLGRGGLVAREALLDALRSGRLGGAGLDVFWEEPPDATDPIFAENVIATPHVGGMTDVSTQGIFEVVRDELAALATERGAAD